MLLYLRKFSWLSVLCSQSLLHCLVLPATPLNRNLIGKKKPQKKKLLDSPAFFDDQPGKTAGCNLQPVGISKDIDWAADALKKLHPLPTLCTIFTTCIGMLGRRIATAPYRLCEHKGKLHSVGEDWTADCEKCSCGPKGMRCCSLTNTPIYDEQICEATFHEESCSYTVTKKDNPSEECEITGMVG
ncbi:unnamed protein product [Ranitomeya imitator]|uniref:Beta-microseminoprotein n=1 Tax=Ranitomeya imitator TaxID=111125 RepID=A0ABN9L7Z0_9NEOB|nr:unnamed protein product [Ranitomeya imitator]